MVLLGEPWRCVDVRPFFDNAEREVGILAYSGLFIPEDTGILRILRRKASDGARIRMQLLASTVDRVTRRPGG